MSKLNYFSALEQPNWGKELACFPFRALCDAPVAPININYANAGL